MRVASGAGVRTTALITDMNQVLGHTAGHTTEMREAIDYLTGKRREARLDQVTRALVAEMLLVGGLCQTAPEAMSRIETALSSGRAAEIFGRMVAALGGPSDLLERPGVYLAPAPVVKPCAPTKSGRIAAIDTRAVGVALIELGGGRLRAQDKIDHRVGFQRFPRLRRGSRATTADLHHSCCGWRCLDTGRQCRPFGGPAWPGGPSPFHRPFMSGLQ